MDQTYISCIAGGFFTTKPQGKPHTYYRVAKTQNIWQHQMLDRTRSIMNSYSLLVEMQNGMETLEEVLPVFYNIKYAFTMWPRNPISKCLLTISET